MSAALVEARRWIGTPYRHQASCRGAGCDCLGLVRGVWRAVQGAEPLVLPAYTADWSEPQGEERLLTGACALLAVKAPQDAAPGDVLVFRMRDRSVAKHLGLQGEVGAHPTFVHSYSGHGVIETALSAPWARRIVARLAWPERT